MGRQKQDWLVVCSQQCQAPALPFTGQTVPELSDPPTTTALLPGVPESRAVIFFDGLIAMRRQSQLLFRFGKPTRHFRPVDHVPERGDVVRATILIVQVIGVFPDVESQQWGPTLHQWTVLIGGTFHDQLSLVIREPCPTTPESGGCRYADFFFECC